jgi:HD-GYP domain-containing protein (c-di-GMP phosphodiesterase class II)
MPADNLYIPLHNKSTDHPSHKAWLEEKVFAYLKEHAGKHFDQQVVKVFL